VRLFGDYFPGRQAAKARRRENPGHTALRRPAHRAMRFAWGVTAMFGDFEGLVRLYQLNPVFFTVILIGAMLFIPYSVIYGPTRGGQWSSVPRHKLILFLGLLACEIAWVIYIASRIRNR
jgi:pilus assembly protein TadC